MYFHEYANEIICIYALTTGCMDISNCNIGDIKTLDNDIIGMKSLFFFIFVNDFPLFFCVFINIHEYSKYTNTITCIFDKCVKGPCLWLNLVPNLVVYGKKQLRHY